jgi:hypothetical protein
MWLILIEAIVSSGVPLGSRRSIRATPAAR